MAILSVQEFVARLAPEARIMALDVGAKTIGLATAILGRDEVLPLKTLARTKFTRDAQALVAVMADYGVRGLVVGWPLLVDGTPGKRCQSVRDFTAELDRFLTLHLPLEGGGRPSRSISEGWAGGGDEKESAGWCGTPTLTLPPQGGGDKTVQNDSGIPLTFWDERFSTAHGDDLVDNIGKTAGKRLNNKKRDQVIDALAAQKILEDFMDSYRA